MPGIEACGFVGDEMGDIVGSIPERVHNLPSTQKFRVWG